jgi:hypothetical protein
LKELLSKEVDLPMETSVPEVPHRSGSEPVMEFALLDLSQTAEIFLSHFPKTTCRKLRAIRRCDRSAQRPPFGKPHGGRPCSYLSKARCQRSVGIERAASHSLA